MRDALVVNIGGLFHRWLPRIEENLRVHSKNASAEVAEGNLLLIRQTT